MSQTVITKAFAEWKAQQAVDNKPVVLDEFVFAFIPGQDANQPIPNTEGMPDADKIVYRQAVSKSGVVNANAVVYSVVMGTEVGDFDFNWIGLINKATGIIGAITHAPTQRKVKNASGQQGNTLTRSILMEYAGAQAETQITVPAATWQIDFTARMAGMDEALRLANLDIYGAGAFFDTGFLVSKNGTQFFVTKGLAYVGGLRASLEANQNIIVTTKPTKVWIDVCYTGTVTSAFQTAIKFTVAPTLSNYATNGVAHYVFALASIDAAGNVTDLRPKGSLNEQTGNSTFVRKDKNLTDIANPQEALDTLGGVPKVRKVNNKALTQDITLTPSDVGALPADGTAVAASKLASARKIAGVGFDGTQDISLKPGDVGAYPASGGQLNGSMNAVGDVTSGDGRDIGSGRDVIASRALYESGGRVRAYSPNYKPSANDVGALPITGGDVEYITGARLFATKSGLWEGAGAFAAQLENGSAPFMVPNGFMAPKNVSQYQPIVKGVIKTKDYNYAAAVSFGGVTSGNAQFPMAVISITTDARAVSAWTFNPVDNSFYSPGDINTGKNISAAGNVSVGGSFRAEAGITSPNDIYTDRNIYNKGIIQAGSGVYDTPGVRVYSPNYRPQPSDVNAIARDTCSYAGFAGGNPQSPYMRNSNNDEVVALARYDWVNTRVEDVLRWATQNFVTSITRGAQASMVMDGWLVEAPAGCVLTGGNGNEGSQIGYALYRPLQMYRNGGWVTIDG